MAEGPPPLPAKKPYFIDTSSHEIVDIVNGAIPPATKKAILFWVNVFLEFCQETGLAINFSMWSMTNLNNALCNLYIIRIFFLRKLLLR